MKFKSSIFAQSSGSLAGTVFSHNKGGQYVRNRSTPTNPNTPQQQLIRSLVGGLANLWTNTLTAAQRTAWDTYADNVTLLNSLGEAIHVTGLNMYTRSNTARLAGGLARIDAAPTIFNTGDFTPPSFALDEPNDEIDISFDNTDAWANEDDASMLVYTSQPQGLAINFWKGPYRFAGRIDGDAVTAPTSPAAVTLAFTVATGQRIFARVIVVRADGRVSLPFRGQADA